MTQDREKITDGANDRAIDENIAGTAPGIPDEALAPGEELPQPPSADEERRIRERLGVPEEEDTLPLDGECSDGDAVGGTQRRSEPRQEARIAERDCG
jgi:hypothetical protein